MMTIDDPRISHFSVILSEFLPAAKRHGLRMGWNVLVLGTFSFLSSWGFMFLPAALAAWSWDVLECCSSSASSCCSSGDV